jgi:hypothetical protein
MHHPNKMKEKSDKLSGIIVSASIEVLCGDPWLAF